MITERMIKEMRKGEIVKTRKYSYWIDGNTGNICRNEREAEGTTDFKIAIVGSIGDDANK